MNETLTTELRCQACYKKCTIPMPQVYRTQLCDIHPSPAICGVNPHVCETCQADGWESKYGCGFGFDSGAKNKNTGEFRGYEYWSAKKL